MGTGGISAGVSEAPLRATVNSSLSGTRRAYAWRNPRECTKCHYKTTEFEKHHIVYGRGMRKILLCVPCHKEITSINTMFWRYKGKKLQNYQRWYLWLAFLSIEKDWFSSAHPSAQQEWIVWLAQHCVNLQMQTRSSAPRGQFTDDAEEVKNAGSAYTASNLHSQIGEQAALLGAEPLQLRGDIDCAP